MADDREIEEVFERGRRVGQLEGIPFQGVQSIGSWLPGARFTFFSSWFESFVRYERHVVESLRELQRMRWLLQQGVVEAKTSVLLSGHSKETLEHLEQEIQDELMRVRWAVDGTLEEGCGRASVVGALRASPQRPVSVTEYDDAAAFIAEDPRRGIRNPEHVAVRPGTSFGNYWRLENPFRRWETSSWCIAWLCDPHKPLWEAWEDEEWFVADEEDVTNEVYAIEALDKSNPFAEDGRVWLLGAIQKRASINRALDELKLHAMRDRNSLVAAADAIAAEQAEEASDRRHDQA